jgi:hypothetical protein
VRVADELRHLTLQASIPFRPAWHGMCLSIHDVQIAHTVLSAVSIPREVPTMLSHHWFIRSTQRLSRVVRLRPLDHISVLVMVLLTSAWCQGGDQPLPPDTGSAPLVAGSTETTGAPGWPRRFTAEGHSVTVYQPQPERLTGNTLTARAAISVSVDGGDPVFGAEWITARLDIDRERRIAEVSSLTIDKIRFPVGEAGDQAAAAMESHLRRALTPKNMVFDLDRLISTLEQVPNDTAAYNVQPPRILVRTSPTELLLIDGPPKLQPAGAVKRLVNTPAFVCVDAIGSWWMRTGDGWLTATGIQGPWSLGAAPAAVVASAEASGVQPSTAAPPGTTAAPAVLVATVPTELVEFDGEPRWTPITDTGILAAENSNSDAFMDTATQHFWLLLAGRWFSSSRLADDATWTFCPPNKLPPGFAAIPPGSRWSGTRVHVSGTDEAREATLDANIPQTAHIPRSSTISVTYDGAPHFIAIPDTDVQWADNSVFAVFQTPGPLYWCCSNGVWYQASSALGPWTVATSVPQDLHQIPADNPNHNVSYVDVYGSTDNDVVSGYTSGYLDEFTYDGTPIYGCGWAWPGYYGSGYWCPRALTWGLHMDYDPWTGGWYMGPGSLGRRGIEMIPGQGNHHGGWWGPTERPPMWLPRPVVSPGQHTARQPGDERRETSAGGRQSSQPLTQATIFSRVPGARLPTGEGMALMDAQVVKDHVDRVFVDHDGNVVRRTDAGTWEERRNKTWGSIDWTSDNHRAAPATAPAPGPAPVQRALTPDPRPVAPEERPTLPAIERPAAPEPRSEPRIAPEPTPRFQQLENSYQQRERSTLRASPPMRSESMPNNSGGGGGGGGGGERRTH